MYSDITAWWATDYGSSSRMTTEEDKSIPVCGVRAFRTTRKRHPHLTACVLEPNHTGKAHVYCLKVPAGVDENSHSLHYYEEVTRKILKPIAIFEVAGRFLMPDNDCAAFYQYMEAVKEMRSEKPTNGS